MALLEDAGGDGLADVDIGPGPETLRDAVRDVCALGGWRVGSPGKVRIALVGGAGQSVASRGEAPALLCRVGQAVGPGVDLVVPGDEAALLVALDHRLGSERGRVVAVRGRSGGVGTSTIAAALAWQLGDRCVLVDADPAGGGAERLVGVSAPLVGGGGTLLARGAVDALPRWGEVALVRARPSGVAAVCEALARDARWVVVDVGRGAQVRADALIEVENGGISGISGREDDAGAATVHAPLAARVHVGRIPPARRGEGVVTVRVRSLRAPIRAIEAGFGPRPACSRRFARAVARMVKAVNECWDSDDE
ncbi:MAG: hypothetical protein E7A62_08450 [Actinomycetaceae bacterium]|nr:hypothetical protein [Actinomycetaceae bacterium]MDU0971005.1 hypothetical protein [Actinomycetaceae bacterium]